MIELISILHFLTAQVWPASELRYSFAFHLVVSFSPPPPMTRVIQCRRGSRGGAVPIIKSNQPPCVSLAKRLWPRRGYAVGYLFCHFQDNVVSWKDTRRAFAARLVSPTGINSLPRARFLQVRIDGRPCTIVIYAR